MWLSVATAKKKQLPLEIAAQKAKLLLVFTISAGASASLLHSGSAWQFFFFLWFLYLTAIVFLLVAFILGDFFFKIILLYPKYLRYWQIISTQSVIVGFIIEIHCNMWHFLNVMSHKTRWARMLTQIRISLPEHFFLLPGHIGEKNIYNKQY